MSETVKLTSFCHSIVYESLPDEVIETTKKLIVDCLGIIVRSIPTEASQSALKTALSLGSTGDSTVIGTKYKLSASHAALVNGTAAHGIELDDVTSESSLHPGVVIIPTAIAMAEELKASNEDVIAAVVAGYEMMMRLGEAIMNPKGNYDSGFHPTGVCGVFGAAVAAGKLLKLSEEELLSAMGICGSMASGSMEYLTEGAWTKKLHAGWAAHNGIIAAKLAQNDFVGPRTVFEGKFGFLNSYSSVQQLGKLRSDYSSPYKLIEANMKFHACCRYNHAQIDAAVALNEEYEIDLSMIQTIETTVLSAGASLVAVPFEAKQRPQNVVDAQFSLPFGIAAALVYGKAGFNEYTEAAVNNVQMQELMQKVKLINGEEFNQRFPSYWGAKLVIHLADGRQFEKVVEHPKGGWPGKAPSWSDVISKFMDLTNGLLSSDEQYELVEHAKNFRSEENIHSIIGILQTTNKV